MGKDLTPHLDEQDMKIFSMSKLDDKLIKEDAEKLSCAASAINYRIEKKIIPTIQEVVTKEELFSQGQGQNVVFDSYFPDD